MDCIFRAVLGSRQNRAEGTENSHTSSPAPPPPPHPHAQPLAIENPAGGAHRNDRRARVDRLVGVARVRQGSSRGWTPSESEQTHGARGHHHGIGQCFHCPGSPATPIRPSDSLNAWRPPTSALSPSGVFFSRMSHSRTHAGLLRAASFPQERAFNVPPRLPVAS